MEGVNCNTKLRKKFISVAVYYSFLQQPKELKKTKKNNFPCRSLNHPNLLFLIQITFNSPDLSRYLCGIFRKFLRNKFGGTLRLKKVRLDTLQLP